MYLRIPGAKKNIRPAASRTKIARGAKCAGFAQFAGESRTSRANIKDSLLEGVEFELSGDFLSGQ